MHNSAWKRARIKAAEKYLKVLGKPCPNGFLHIRVHDLKHSLGHRLREAGVSHEDHQDLLGHKSGSITTHYSSAEKLLTFKELMVATGGLEPPTPAL